MGLLSLLTDNSMNLGEKLVVGLALVFAVLLSLSIHELSHGLAAYWMGDKTAKYSGRLSLNPLHHLDPIGAICLFLFGFGWAKPVPVNARNFNNKKGGMVLTALAGPVSNFILAFFAQFGLMLMLTTPAGDSELILMVTSVIAIICQYLVYINLGLGLFNLIPIPPLDGSKILNAVLPYRLYFKIMEYERYGFILLIILINLPIFDNFLFGAETLIMNFYNSIIGIFIG